VKPHHRWDDPRCAIGGGCDDPPASCILFVDRHCPEVDPVKDRQRIAQVGALVRREFGRQGWRAAPDIKPAGQNPMLAAPAID
jgi:hypothetical protein